MQRRHIIGFVAFCLLSGSGWLVDNVSPSSLPSLEQQGLHFLVVTLAMFGALLLRPHAAVSPPMPLLPLAAASILLLGLPALLNQSAYAVSARSGIALFTLVPLCIVVGAVAFHAAPADPQPSRALMMPALIGFAGAALLPSFQLPADARQGLLFFVVFVAVLFTATGSLWMYDLLRGQPIAPSATILCGANALFLAAVAALTDFVLPSPGALLAELLRALIFDLPQLLLLVWLLRELDPARCGARFVLAPLLSIVEGILLLHLHIDLRMGGTILLMTLGGAMLLLWDAPADSEAPPSLGLR